MMFDKKSSSILMFLMVLLILASLTAACTAVPSPAGTRTLTVMTHDSFAISEEIIRSFENEHQVKVSFIRSGDTGSALNQAVLSKENPLADVFYGVDSTFLTRALEEGIFESPPRKSRTVGVQLGHGLVNLDQEFLWERDLYRLKHNRLYNHVYIHPHYRDG